MVELISPRPDHTIVEIGPGRGALTVPLAESGADLYAVEFDRDMIAFLDALLGGFNNITLINKDFLLFRPGEHGLKQFTLVGNLPYNITSPVIEWTITMRQHISSAFFMVQKEVARRITGSPGGKDWSPLSIFTQIHFNATYCFDVPQHAFTPPPEVVSAVIRLDPWPHPPKVDPVALEPIVRAAFKQRRKTLVNNLVPDIIPDIERARNLLSELGLPHNVRAEQVTITDFNKLARSLSNPGTKGESLDKHE